MPFRRFSLPDASVSVEVRADVFDSMVANCRKSPDKETGGVLIGRYINDGIIAQILEALPPPVDSVGTSCTFTRGTHGLSNELNLRWIKAGSYYVGEWHYHPLGCGQPSERDTSQMIEFARENDMQSPVPILVIVFRLGNDQYELRTFLFTRDGHTLILDDVTGKSEGD